MKILRDFVIVAVALVAAVVVASRCYGDRLSEWEERARSALAVAEVQKARADTLQQEADRLRSQAEELAAEVAARAPVTDTLILELPPAETPGEFARDTIITRLVEERDGALAAFERQSEAMAKLQQAFDVAVERGDSLAAVLEDRPSERPWWIPRLGLGPAAGYNRTDGPHFDPLTVHLSWEIKLGG